MLLTIFVIGSNSGFAENVDSTGNGVATPLPLSETASLCGKSIPPEKPIESISPTDQRIHVQADTADISENNSTVFNGDVKIQQSNRSLQADRVIYNKDTEVIDASGNIQLRQDAFVISGDNANVEFNNDKAIINNATYHDYDTRGQGTAKTISILNKSEASLQSATYTTCDPKDPDWVLSADKIELDNKNRQGHAYNVVVKFKGVPFLYLPYIRFPLGKDRLSGFLYPSFGSSEKHGGEIFVPYYWNIHPQLDAVITPHDMSKRGTQLLSEVRYLTESQSGTLNIEYLPDDKLTNTTRDAYRWQHNGNAGNGWSFNVDYRSVSDIYYLTDFGNSLETASTTHLEQRADVSYNAADWEFRGRFQEFQTLLGSEPVKMQPQLLFNTRQNYDPNTFSYDFAANWTNFTHKTLSPVGERTVLLPQINYSLVYPAVEIKPSLLIHYTQFDLDRTAANQDNQPTRTVPIFSLDSTVFLERDIKPGTTTFIQTLEPRIKYVYIPYRDQDNLPLFDTASLTSSIEQAFANNRFTGDDRIGDTNQISFGLTSRILSENGNELMMMTVGQTRYFADRRVTLSGGPPDTTDSSPLYAGLSFRPNQFWTVYGNLQYDTELNQTFSRDAHIQYRSDANHIFNLGYRSQRNQLETREISAIWRLHPQWKLIGRNHYDMLNERDLENIFGIQYDSCCWGFRLVKRKYYNKPGQDDAYEDAIFFEMEFKGLSSFGQYQDIDTTLGNSIPGYTKE